MKKFILVFLVFYQTFIFAGTAGWPYKFVKIFDRGTYVEVGLNLSCPFNGLSVDVNPNWILTQSENNFAILLSMQDAGGIMCSPLPPEFIDKVRTYFNLGQLQPGEYTITVKYVNNLEIPPDSGVAVYEFPQFTFHVAHPIPSINKFGLMFLALLLIWIYQRFMTKQKNTVKI